MQMQWSNYPFFLSLVLSEQHNYWEDNKIIQTFASQNYTKEHQLNTVSYAFIFKTNKGSKKCAAKLMRTMRQNRRYLFLTCLMNKVTDSETVHT